MKEMIFLAIAMLGFSFVTCGENSCAEFLKNYYANTPAFNKPDTNEIISAEIEIHYDFNRSVDMPNRLLVKMEMTPISLVYENEMLSVFQDTTYLFLVIHSAKRIIWSDSDGDFSETLKQENDILSILEKYMEHAHLSCIDSICDGTKHRYVQMKFGDEYRTFTKLEEVEMVFSMEGPHLEKVRYNYYQHNSLNSLEYVYSKYEKKPLTDESSLPAESFVFSEQGTKRRKYSNYTITDNRQK